MTRLETSGNVSHNELAELMAEYSMALHDGTYKTVLEFLDDLSADVAALFNEAEE